ncbi:MAG: CRISPR system precrRNA processing endoribonuclease RAMP protein Cas6 [Acidobacteriota bacterium]|nr:CRISPR system precrRNA processing endoribonuclease RAMP protein Cas6 [Blastocatellia bacterium]MDW8238332.1 CRISPR system precrRNA processing endoribonuclease RAMP protein Cas6 [Acidobacteriota bacterium]
MRTETEAWLPRYKGSTLRGAFGNALKRAVCIRRDLNCEICLVRPSCVYTQVFETLPPEGVAAFRGQKVAPHPYVLEPPLEEKQQYAPGEPLTFGLTLIGRAIDYLPYIIFALDQAGQKGLGQRRGRFVLESVAWRDGDGHERVIYESATQRLASGSFSMSAEEWIAHRHAQISSNLESSTLSNTAELHARTTGGESEISNLQSSHLRLVFLTPVRLQVQGDLQGGISFELLVRNLLRRMWQLTLVHGGGELVLDHRAMIEQARSVMTVRNELRWLDWERYSNRQQTKMKLGGLVGEVEYGFAGAAELGAFLPLVILGELLHVGKNTTFGLGKYEIASLRPLTDALALPGCVPSSERKSAE